MRLFPASQLDLAGEHPGGVAVVVENLADGARTGLEADAVIYATGYRPADPAECPGRTASLLRRDRHDRVVIGRDYRVELTAPCTAGLFVTGISEHAHGASTTLLSNLAVRAGELVESVRRNPAPGTLPVRADLDAHVDAVDLIPRA